MNRTSMAISIGALILGLVLDLWIPPTAYAYNNTSVRGTITCTSSVLAGPTVTASGSQFGATQGAGEIAPDRLRSQGGFAYADRGWERQYGNFGLDH